MQVELSSPTVQYEKRDRVAWITLNRPERLNALNPDLGGALNEAIEDATADDDILVLVIAGEGGKAFSAGMDLKWRTEQDSAGGVDSGGSLGLDEVGNCPKPIIAAIDGYCVAGGMQLSNRCDIRIATEQSQFGMPEARRALTAVGTMDTPEMFCPPGEAAWILLTGSFMTASRAYDIGLIQALVPDREALFVEAERVAGEVKKCAPLAVRAIKHVLRTKMNITYGPEGRPLLDQLTELTAEAKGINADSEDRLEGPKAFAEKRDAVWKNR